MTRIITQMMTRVSLPGPKCISAFAVIGFTVMKYRSVIDFEIVFSHPDWKAFDALRCRRGHSTIFSIVEVAERLLHLADITSNSTISMAITKVVISENVPCNGWLWK
jgi:hypothetical protein